MMRVETREAFRSSNTHHWKYWNYILSLWISRDRVPCWQAILTKCRVFLLFFNIFMKKVQIPHGLLTASWSQTYRHKLDVFSRCFNILCLGVKVFLFLIRFNFMLAVQLCVCADWVILETGIFFIFFPHCPLKSRWCAMAQLAQILHTRRAQSYIYIWERFGDWNAILSHTVC